MSKRRFEPIRTARAWDALPQPKRDTHLRVLDVISAMRRNPNTSLRQAAIDWNTTPETVRRYAGPVVQRSGRRFVVSSSDRLYAPVRFYTDKGLVTIGTTDSRVRSKMGRHMNAVDRYLKTGKTDHLTEFRGQFVRAQKVAYPFITNPRTLDRLASAGEISYEDFYARAS